MQRVRHTEHLIRQQGFTLLELLIASIIFAIMALMAYGGLNNVITNSKASKQALTRLQQVQQGISILDRDFTQIIKRPIRDEFGVTQPYLMAGNNLDELVEFTRGGRVNPAKLLRSSMLRVAYRMKENALVRVQWQHLDRAQGVEPKTTTILDKLSEVSIRFLGKGGQWHSQWPVLNADTADRDDERPLAIEVVLKLEDWGDIRRLYATN